ncbi:MAG: DUF2892 domain-containing protein [Candidatus Aminicenantes bacterium]|nr:DUF2892 domain-containing protein [Candidatus Aminicenantes bacterium]
MKKNMGTWDRMLRTGVALVIAVLIVTKIVTGTLGIVLGVIAAMFLLTSAIGFCPLYVLFKFSTCRVKKED